MLFTTYGLPYDMTIVASTSPSKYASSCACTVVTQEDNVAHIINTVKNVIIFFIIVFL
jgi:hypothetical protein